ncbi:MAG: DUF4912 domain-containing protein [Bacillota bacterium]
MNVFLAVAGIVALIILAIYVIRMSARPARKPEVNPEQREEYYLPQEYGEDKVALMVKDPYWLHAYWEISPQTREEIHRKYGQPAWGVSQPLLRLYEVSSELGATRELISHDLWLNDDANNWYIHVGKPNCSFYVDLGRLLPDGTFVVFARSNWVTTPRDRMSEIIDPNWPPIDEVLGLSLGRYRDVKVGHVPGSPYMSRISGSSVMDNNRKD